MAWPINKLPLGPAGYQKSIIKLHPVTYPTLWDLTALRPHVAIPAAEEAA